MKGAARITHFKLQLEIESFRHSSTPLRAPVRRHGMTWPYQTTTSLALQLGGDWILFGSATSSALLATTLHSHGVWKGGEK